MVSGSFSRGTTLIQIFTLPFEQELLSDLRITYSQNQKKILTKNKEDVELSGNDIIFTLTQEETLDFSEKYLVSVQLKVKTIDEQVFNSNIIYLRVDPSLDEEVI